MTTPTIRIWYAIMVAFIACVLVAVAGVSYTNHVQRQSERHWEEQRRLSDDRWCRYFNRLIEIQRRYPPQTESGKEFAAELVRQRNEFGCTPPQ